MRWGILTFNVGKGAEGPAGAAARLLHVVTLGGFIDLQGRAEWPPGTGSALGAPTLPPHSGTPPPPNHPHPHSLRPWALPRGETAALCVCGMTGRRLHSHTCQGRPTHPHASRSDTETTWGGGAGAVRGCNQSEAGGSGEAQGSQRGWPTWVCPRPPTPTPHPQPLPSSRAHPANLYLCFRGPRRLSLLLW